MGGSRTTHAAGWTEDRVGTLKKLWLEGQSANQIAKQLGGGVTTNAVIGKVHRLGLSGRTTPAQPARAVFKPSTRRPARPQKPVTSVAPKAIAAPPEPKAEELPGTAVLRTLGLHMCKWPIGDPASTEFSFCGRASGRDVYCVEHGRVAYQPKSGGNSGRVYVHPSHYR
jgi:GcrA cell cycle regulator